ncbi:MULTISPECIES: SSI family serine proteinase inhibitor [unclassified Streptomyces]|uniref:SSI family serine proteinase inhibitor n=1 Tax=unclassified Streptomyces TaxID=2593676 RepID=UPI002E36B1DD|nr:SSI family serine proteinase inhibitor [Streptomyces sp. NBC_01268]
MLRRLVLATLAPLAVTAAASGGGLGALPPLPLFSVPDSLTIVVADAGSTEADGTFRLECEGTPGGTHPAAGNACKKLAEFAAAGVNPFAPVPKDQMCTQQYGGPATAHVTGDWQGRSIDARFSRANGCEIGRWDDLRPVLPRVQG